MKKLVFQKCSTIQKIVFLSFFLILSIFPNIGRFFSVQKFCIFVNIENVWKSCFFHKKRKSPNLKTTTFVTGAKNSKNPHPEYKHTFETRKSNHPDFWEAWNSKQMLIFPYHEELGIKIRIVRRHWVALVCGILSKTIAPLFAHDGAFAMSTSDDRGYMSRRRGFAQIRWNC